MTASGIISLWPSAEHFADDIGAKYRSYGRVLKMRGRIPERYWTRVLEGAERRGIAVTHADLVAAHVPVAAPEAA